MAPVDIKKKVNYIIIEWVARRAFLRGAFRLTGSSTCSAMRGCFIQFKLISTNLLCFSAFLFEVGMTAPLQHRPGGRMTASRSYPVRPLCDDDMATENETSSNDSSEEEDSDAEVLGIIFVLNCMHILNLVK